MYNEFIADFYGSVLYSERAEEISRKCAESALDCCILVAICVQTAACFFSLHERLMHVSR